MNHAVNIPFEDTLNSGDESYLTQVTAKRDEKNQVPELYLDRNKLGDRNKLNLRTALTPHSLFAAEACATKGALYINPRLGSIGLSSFTNQFVQDGKSFEAILENRPETWLKAFNKVTGYNLSSDIRVINFSKMYAGTDTFSPEMRNIVQAMLKSLSTLPTPALFMQVPMFLNPTESQELFGVEREARGILDVAIWTGHSWVLGEIKRTENTLVQYCIQIEFYCRAIQSLVSDIKIASNSFVITCSPGFAYSNWETAEHNRLALANLHIEVIDRELIKPRLSEAIQRLFVPTEAIEQDPFQPKCVECEFRSHCYTRHLGVGVTDIGLLTMSEASIRRLKQAGINTVEEFLSRGKHDPIILSVCFGSLSTELWLRRAKIVNKMGGYSSWRPRQTWIKNYWTACAPKDESGDAAKLEWFTPQGHHIEPPNLTPPAVIFTYTRAEASRVKAKLFEDKRNGVLTSLPDVIALQEELRQKVRFPYTSFTIEGICSMLESVAKGEHAREDFTRWLPQAMLELQKKSKRVPVTRKYPSRAETLAAIVEALVTISQLCSEEQDASLI